MFNLEDILIQENMDLSRPIDDHRVTECSYLDRSIRGMKDYKADLRETTESFYKGLVVSEGNSEIVSEVFIDNFKESSKAISKFINIIEGSYDKFVANAKPLVSDEFINKYKKLLETFCGDNEFTYKGRNYDFSHSFDTPNAKSLYEYGITSIGKDVKTEDKISAYNVYIKENAAEFEDVLYNYLIESNTNPALEQLLITRNDIYRYLDEYSMDSEDMINLKRMKDNICESFSNIKNSISSTCRDFSDNDYKGFISKYIDSSITEVAAVNISDESRAIINLAVRDKISEATKLMDTYATYFGNLLDSMTESLRQNRRILYLAINELGVTEKGTLEVDDTDEEDTISANLGEDDLNNGLEKIEVNEDGSYKVTDTFGRSMTVEGDHTFLEIMDMEETLLMCLKKGILDIDDAGEEDTYAEDLLGNVDLTLSEKIDNNINYDSFLASEAFEDAKLFALIKEYTMRMEGTYTTEAMIAIQEGLADSAKGVLRKIWNAIVTMWNKFVQTMDGLVKNEKEYLEKYKEIILSRQVKFASSITTNQYFDNDHGVSLALSSHFNGITSEINDFTNIGKFKNVDSETIGLEDKNKFLKKIGASEIQEEDQFQARILEQLKGDENTTYDADTIHTNMKNMYDFCYNYNTYKNSAQTLVTKIENFVKTSENMINKVAAENDNVNTAAQTSTGLENAINFSANYFISEAITKNGPPVDDTKPASSTASNTNKSSAYNTTSSVSKKETIVGDDGERKTINRQESLKKHTDGWTNEELENTRKVLSSRLNMYAAVLGAKITFGQVAFKDYMQIIKSHVSYYANNERKNNETNKAATPTNTDVKMAKPMK